MRDYPHVLSRLLNTPLLAHPEKAEIVAGVVLRRAGVDVEASATVNLGPVQEAVLRERHGRWNGGKPFLFADGVALIEVTGSLAHRQWHIGESSGVMGYDGIGAQLDAALADIEVNAILLDVHSPGGEVSGAFQLADRIRAAGAVKPVVAIADEIAFSAAYLLASAAGEVWLAAETAAVGSVGVVYIHFSFEAFLEAEGIKPTIVQAGARKADGNPFQDLPAAVRDRIQRQIDAVHDLFVGRVAAWRGKPENAIRATEAGVFMGREAVELGLADGIAQPQEVFEALARSPGAARPALRAV